MQLFNHEIMFMLLKQCGNAKRSKHLKEDIHCCQSLVLGARPEPGACSCSAGGASSQPLIEDRSNAAAFGSELNRLPLTQGMWPAICQHAESIPSLICYIFPFPPVVLLHPRGQRGGTGGQEGRGVLGQGQQDVLETDWVSHDMLVQSYTYYLNYLSSLLEYF